MTDTHPQSRPRLGFIGLGAMGGRMAHRLLAAGYELTAHDRDDARAHGLEQAGAKFASTTAQLASSVDVVLSSLNDDAALEAVMFAADGALQAARPGTIFIDMSTVSPRASLRLHDAATTHGLDVLDAPVSGSTPLAQEGQLMIIVGGREEVYRSCRPIFDVLGRASFYMGPGGSGAATKLCLNALLGLGMQALAESLALGLRSGLSRDRLLAVLADSTVLSPSQKSKLENVKNNEYSATFPLRLMFKDFGLISERALELSVAMPSTAAAAQVCAVTHAQQGPPGDVDFSVVIRTVLAMAGS